VRKRRIPTPALRGALFENASKAAGFILDEDRGLKNCLGRMDFDKTRLNEPWGDRVDRGDVGMIGYGC